MIRKATIEDAQVIATIGYLVTYELYDTIAQTQAEKQKQIQDLAWLVEQDDVPMSYLNAYVYEEDKQILGVTWIYDYNLYATMLENMYAYGEDTGIQVPDLQLGEAELGDYYLDTIAVSEASQGKGIGKQLLRYMIDMAEKNDLQLSLIVDSQKIKPYTLYSSLGFKKVSEKNLYGSVYYYMRYNN